MKVPNENQPGDTVFEIEVASKVTQGQISSGDYHFRIQSRIYDSERERLARERIFVQYGRGTDDRIKALEDVRLLIQKYGEEGAYLWDPYLSGRDLIQTLFFCKTAHVPLRAIGSNKVVGLQKKDKACNAKNSASPWPDWVKEQVKLLEGSSNHVGLNTEFRCKCGNAGWGFHDRFLIFPRMREPLAWSLGISVNQLGKEHHILQRVDNAQNILDAFNDLWSVLKNPNCLIWKKL